MNYETELENMASRAASDGKDNLCVVLEAIVASMRTGTLPDLAAIADQHARRIAALLPRRNF